jgi:hypoxanthine phosphoribosyltransferase
MMIVTELICLFSVEKNPRTRRIQEIETYLPEVAMMQTNKKQEGSGPADPDHQKEMDYLQREWIESRASIDRFDRIAVDLRKYGFSLITFLIMASSIAFQSTQLTSPLPILIVSYVITILICGLFLTDRYYEVLLLSSVLRSRQLEDASQELFETYIPSHVYFRINMTTLLENNIRKTKAHLLTWMIYGLFIIASFLLGLLTLLASNQQKGTPIFLYSIIALIGLLFLALGIFLVINHNMAGLIKEIGRNVLIDEKLVIWKLFDKYQVIDAKRELVKKIHDFFKGSNFKILTVGMGGLMLGSDLISGLVRKGRTNIETISAFTERDGDTVTLIPPDEEDLKGENILIVDDLISTGLTVEKIIDVCQKSGATSIQICTLVDAPLKRKTQKVKANFVGLTSTESKRFFVGCGLDGGPLMSEENANKCRDLPFIGVIV